MNEDKISQELTDLKVEVAKLAQDLKGAFRRIDEQKQLSESVHTLALSVERQTMALEQQGKDIKALQQDMESIKSRPAKRMDSAVAAIIAAAISVAVTFFATKAGLK